MKKVFVVTSGQYSDYGVDAIFTTKELAENFINAFKSDSSYDEKNIEEWDLDPYDLHLKQNRKPYFLRINKNGDTRDLELCDSVYGFSHELGVSYTHNEDWMNIYCFADDEKHAVKIANERRTQVIAANIWGILIDDLSTLSNA